MHILVFSIILAIFIFIFLFCYWALIVVKRWNKQPFKGVIIKRLMPVLLVIVVPLQMLGSEGEDICSLIS